MLLHFFVTSSFSLPVFSFFLFGHVPSCSAWPALRVGHAALCLLPVWFRGAVLCRLGRRRCECVDIVFFRGSCLRAPRFPRPLPLHVRSIEDAFFSSQSLTVLLVGRAGWLHLLRRQNHLPAPPARTAPLRSSPSSALAEDSSHGSRERKNSFRSFFHLLDIHYQIII